MWIYSNFATLLHLASASSSLKEFLIIAHSFVITDLSSAAVLDARIARIKSFSFWLVGMMNCKVNSKYLTMKLDLKSKIKVNIFTISTLNNILSRQFHNEKIKQNRIKTIGTEIYVRKLQPSSIQSSSPWSETCAFAHVHVYTFTKAIACAKDSPC